MSHDLPATLWLQSLSGAAGAGVLLALAAGAGSLARSAAPELRVTVRAAAAIFAVVATTNLVALGFVAGQAASGAAMIAAGIATAIAIAVVVRSVSPRFVAFRTTAESEARDHQLEEQREVERELRRQGAIVDLLRAIAVAANEASSAEPAILVALRRICDFTGWPIGHAYLVGDEPGTLRSSSLWQLSDPGRFVEFRRVTEATKFRRGVGLPGGVFANGRPRWIEDVASEPDFLRARWAKDLGVHGAFAFPLLVGTEVVGVLEFFSTERATPDTALLGVMADIGAQLGRVVERKRAEQDLARARDAALEASRLKSSFLANVSHEIRTPLNVILGYNAIIAERLSEDAGERVILDGIDKASHRLLETIHGILDLSKIETNTFRVAPVATDLARVLRRHAEELGPIAANKGLALRCEIEEPDAGVLFDEYCLSSSLGHLVQNAVKFTERGEVVLRLYRGDDFALRLEVRDTGIGIDRDYLPKLFSPFSQEEQGYTRRFEGSGLGLALTRKYLALNEAELTASSEKGSGSTFTIRFSKGRELWDRIEEGEAKPVPPAAAPGAPPVVLVVEDDPDTRAYMRTALRGQYEVLEASSGAEMRRRLAERGGEVRVVLMDLSLRGDEDGLMLTRYLRARDAWRRLPVIAVTAHAFEEDRTRALDAGCDHYLSKPIDRVELIATMASLIASPDGANGDTVAA